MKKLFCILIIMTSTLSLAACGQPLNNDLTGAIPNSTTDVNSEDSNEIVSNVVDVNDPTNTNDTVEINSEVTDKNTVTSSSPEISDSNNETTIVLVEDSNKNSSSSTDSNNPIPNSEETVVVTDTTERIFKISTLDATGATNNVIYDDNLVTVGVGVGDNIRLILGTVSTNYFDGNAIELQTIEGTEGNLIAVVNLCGSETYWHNKFSGSAQGSSTEHSLIENVLQRDYTGYWVNGVRFTLNGKPISDTGHIPNLSTTSYR